MRSLRRRRDDEGMALVFVVGTMMVLAMLALTALAYVGQSTKFARYDQDDSSAMSAAQAGVDDFISHLNRDDTYWKTVDCTNTALKGPSQLDGNTDCGWNASTPVGWQPVQPGVTGAKAAYFHYSYDDSATVSGGPVVLTVTGRINGEYRTVEATVGKGSSTDYVYYTDFESADPSNKQAYPSTPNASCGGNGYANAQYFYNGRSGCQEITFVSGDTLNGPVFSNDSVLSDGATFSSAFESANPGCDTVTASTSTWKNCLRSGTANFGKQPSYQHTQYLDDNSAQFASDPGCHYYGSTRIVFNGDGTMTVWNNTANGGGTKPTLTRGPGDTADPTCGLFPALGSAAGATVPVPNNEVIYVSQDTTGLARSQCDAGQLGGPTGQTLPLGTYTKAKAAAKPTKNKDSYDYDQSMTETTKYCQEGNLYVEGVIKGRVSLAAEQSVIVTGDLVLKGGLNGSDMLGLVATNSVEVFHPWMYQVSGPNSGCPSSSCKWGSASEEGAVSGWPHDYADPTGGTVVNGVDIMGSIQTLQHSFYVQQYNKGGCQNTLQVNGSIAQRWRGIVGTGTCSTGYLKKYVYDKRLVYSSPPYFPHWVKAQWKQRYFGEVKTPAAVKQ